MDYTRDLRKSAGADPRVELMTLRGSPLGEDVYNYLQHRKYIPDIRRTSYLGDGTSGRYSHGYQMPPMGLLELTYGAGPDTQVHEFSHAADNALKAQYFDRPTSWGIPDVPTPFTDAYEKLVGGVARSQGLGGNPSKYTYQREDMANKLDPAWYNKNKDYRASNRELVGWGAGSTEAPRDMRKDYAPPQHLDSTMATELSIMLDLAQRADKPFPQGPSLTTRILDYITNLSKK